jgi:hypothetical protein
VIAIGQPLDDLRSRLLPGKVEKELFDVLNLQRTLLERILLDQVLHGPNYIALWRDPAHGT